MVVVLSHLGYVKRVPLSSYRKQKRGGRGIKGAGTKEKDFVEHLFVASTHDYIFFFTDRGRVHRMKVYDLPQLERVARGKPIGSLLNLRKGERVTECVFAQGSEGYLVMATRQGVVKRTLLSAFNNTRRGGIQAINLPEEDRLIGVSITNGENEIVLGTEQGLSIRFREGDMRSMGRTAYGVNGINLSQNDHVVDMIVAEKDATILTVSENGYGKRSLLDDYRLQSRAGKGIINIKATDRNGLVVGMKEVNDEDDILLITQGGIIVRLRVKEIRTMGRNTQGVRVIRLDKGDRLVAIARVEHEDNGNS
jgi:DNA gyrase subunit A